jgi:hypothetical protein
MRVEFIQCRRTEGQSYDRSFDDEQAIKPIVLATAVLGSNSAGTDLEMRTVVKEERLNSTWSPHGGDDTSRCGAVSPVSNASGCLFVTPLQS